MPLAHVMVAVKSLRATRTANDVHAPSTTKPRRDIRISRPAANFHFLLAESATDVVNRYDFGSVHRRTPKPSIPGEVSRFMCSVAQCVKRQSRGQRHEEL